MSEDKPNAIAGAVAYIQQYKEQYSIEELRQKLKASGYPELVVFEAEKQAFAAVNKNDPKVSSVNTVTEKLLTGKKIGEFAMGFIGFYVLVIVGLGLIGLGIAVFLYFYLRKKRIYIARGILAAFILSIILIAAVILFLFIVFGGIF